jgi:hypothetical protein
VIRFGDVVMGVGGPIGLAKTILCCDLDCEKRNNLFKK